MGTKMYNAYQQEIELTTEQQACLKYSGDKILMVKGFAGAGKSIVLVALATKYIEKYGKDAKNKVAIFTFQNTLVSSMRETLELDGRKEQGVAVVTINAHVYELYKYFLKIGIAPKRKYFSNDKSDKEKKLDIIKKALSEHKSKYGKHRFHDIEPEFWVDEFDWMKQMNVWTDDLDYYLTIPRKGRGGRVRMSADDRVVAYKLFLSYCAVLDKIGHADWADQTLFTIRHAKQIPAEMKFDHVLVDEAQDLSTAQMIAVMHLYNKDMTIAMDANQKIHNRTWTAKSLGIDTTTKMLTKSMRTTKQIDDLAESVRSKNDAHLSEDDKSLRAIPEREGDIPKLVHLESAAAEEKYVVTTIKNYLKGNSNITIGVIAASHRYIKVISDWLTTADIQHQQISKDSTFSVKEPGVKVVTAYGAKGLEFNCIIIPMFMEGNFPFSYSPDDDEEYELYMIQMRNLVYVSMTRAKNLLTLTYWGDKGSRFIADMNPEKYILEGAPNSLAPIKRKKKHPSEGYADKKYEAIISRGAKPVEETAGTSKLAEFLTNQGLKVIDLREDGGKIWVAGGKEVDLVLKEARERYGSLWIYTEKGSKATDNKPGWYSNSKK